MVGENATQNLCMALHNNLRQFNTRDRLWVVRWRDSGFILVLPVSRGMSSPSLPLEKCSSSCQCAETTLHKSIEVHVWYSVKFITANLLLPSTSHMLSEGPLQKVRLCRKHCEACSRRSLIIVLRHCYTMIAAIDSELRGTLGGWRMICCNTADDCWDLGASISIADILCRPNADNLGYFITCVCSPKT